MAFIRTILESKSMEKGVLEHKYTFMILKNEHV